MKSRKNHHGFKICLEELKNKNNKSQIMISNLVSRRYGRLGNLKRSLLAPLAQAVEDSSDPFLKKLAKFKRLRKTIHFSWDCSSLAWY